MTTSGGNTPVFGFSDVSKLFAVSPRTFGGVVNEEWTIGGKPNGGYLLSMMARAATSVVEHEHVIAASTHYLHSPDPGPVEIETELLRGGRSASQVRCRMSQYDKACVE